MGFSVRVLPEHRLGLVRLAGRVDGRAVGDALRALLLDPGWAPSYATFWDTRDLRTLDLTPEDLLVLRGLAAEHGPTLGPGRAAFLARDEQDAITVRLLDLRRMGSEQREFQAFHTRAAAAAWLGVPEALLAAGVAHGPPPLPAARPEALSSPRT